MVWIRWAIWSSGRASKRKRESASVRRRSPRFGAWRSTFATSSRRRKPRQLPFDGRPTGGEKVRVGPLAVGTLSDWEPRAGATVSWVPTPAARAAVSKAPVSPVPVSYMQAQHIRGYVEQKAKGLDYSRLMVISCDQPGQGDIRALDYVVNTH